MKHSITIIIIFPLLLTSPLFRQFMITTNSSQSDTLQVKSPHIVKQTKFWYILGSPNPPIGNQVKHLLILISLILLLSSPVIGQSKKSGLLYIWENGSRYVGEWKDGKMDGQGTESSPYGDNYEGEFKDG